MLKRTHRSKGDLWWMQSCLRLRDFAMDYEGDYKAWLQHDLHAVDAVEQSDGAHDVTRVDVLRAQTCVRDIRVDMAPSNLPSKYRHAHTRATDTPWAMPR